MSVMYCLLFSVNRGLDMQLLYMYKYSYACMIYMPIYDI